MVSNQHACQIDQPIYEEFKFGHVHLTTQFVLGPIVLLHWSWWILWTTLLSLFLDYEYGGAHCLSTHNIWTLEFLGWGKYIGSNISCTWKTSNLQEGDGYITRGWQVPLGLRIILMYDGVYPLMDAKSQLLSLEKSNKIWLIILKVRSCLLHAQSSWNSGWEFWPSSLINPFLSTSPKPRLQKSVAM